MGLFDFFKKDNSPSPKKLIKAAKKGNLELVNSLIESGIDVNSRNEEGWTPLICASFKSKYEEHTDLIKLLLEKGADLNAKTVKYGSTALMLASANGLVETAKMLMEAGADMNIKDKEDSTALIYALENGWIEIAKMLIEAGAQIDDKNKDDVLTLINVLPEFANNHNLSLVVEIEDNQKVRLPIKADKCTINWGDGSNTEEHNVDSNLYHSYPQTGSYTITINAEGLSKFTKIYTKTTAIYLNNCPQLEELDFGGMKLTTLSIRGCTALWYLKCERNELTSLDLSNNTQLIRVECTQNQLSKYTLNKVFSQLPTHNSSYATVKSTSVPWVFFVCGNNPGFDGCNKQIAKNKNWLVWRKSMLIGATALTHSRWMEVNY